MGIVDEVVWIGVSVPMLTLLAVLPGVLGLAECPAVARGRRATPDCLGRSVSGCLPSRRWSPGGEGCWGKSG